MSDGAMAMTIFYIQSVVSGFCLISKITYYLMIDWFYKAYNNSILFIFITNSIAYWLPIFGFCSVHDCDGWSLFFSLVVQLKELSCCDQQDVSLTIAVPEAALVKYLWFTNPDMSFFKLLSNHCKGKRLLAKVQKGRINWLHLCIPMLLSNILIFPVLSGNLNWVVLQGLWLHFLSFFFFWLLKLSASSSRKLQQTVFQSS